jgi:hypothetical protein
MSWSNDTFHFRHFIWNVAYVKQTQSSLSFLVYVVALLLLLYSVLGCLISEVSRSCSVGHTTHGRTSLDEAFACCEDLYLTTHNIHNRQTTKPSVGFKPTIPSSKRPQTYTLDCVATGIGCKLYSPHKN